MKIFKRYFLAIFFAISISLFTCIAYAGTDPAEQHVGGTVVQAEPETSPNTTPATTVQTIKESLPGWFPQVLGMQFDGIYQKMPDFHSPYQGRNSLSFQHDLGEAISQVYGVYLGSQLTPRLQAYLDIEWFRGNGISDGTGLGGYVNGDAIRSGSSNLPKDPYVARLYFRYSLPLSSETEKVERGMDQLLGDQPVSRWEVKAGKISVADDFDQNHYANNNRTQFLNFDFLYNPAWDYAADTRGYSYGLVTALLQPKWRLAWGVYMMPNTANGADFDFVDTRELEYNLELTLKPYALGTVIRLLAYFNEGRMGSYDAALALSRETATTPNLILVNEHGGTKYGFGLNFEQPLVDDGETGIFGRIGWNDGNNETWNYAESDLHASLGVQVNGMHWGRKKDNLGIAYGVNGLSAPHQNYLAAGGMGMILGDGRLNYGYEQVLEVYYSIGFGHYIQLSPDFQFVQNPGYNRDRGPVEVYGLRLHASF